MTAFFERTGIRLVDGYGSTETGGTISAPPDAQRPGYMGRVLDDFEARVVDDDDEEVPDGTPGELVLRSRQPYSFSTGYLGLPEKTLETWRNLWLHTGDQVVRDADGWYRFHDRNPEVIRRQGENVSAYEVEQTLVSHRAVSLAAVFGVPSPLGEQDVAAAVVVKGGETVTGPELIAHCERHLAHFAVPRYIEFVDTVPITPTGKVRKAKLKERGITGSMWDRESAGHDRARRCR
jgi:crotonobetaine/carnitine-CoA ligase